MNFLHKQLLRGTWENSLQDVWAPHTGLQQAIFSRFLLLYYFTTLNDPTPRFNQRNQTKKQYHVLFFIWMFYLKFRIKAVNQKTL